MKPFMSFAALLLLFGAAMILADIGATALWIAVIAVGVTIVGIGKKQRSTGFFYCYLDWTHVTGATEHKQGRTVAARLVTM
jgi:hypothetical protein